MTVEPGALEGWLEDQFIAYSTLFRCLSLSVCCPWPLTGPFSHPLACPCVPLPFHSPPRRPRNQIREPEGVEKVLELMLD